MTYYTASGVADTRTIYDAHANGVQYLLAGAADRIARAEQIAAPAPNTAAPSRVAA